MACGPRGAVRQFQLPATKTTDPNAAVATAILVSRPHQTLTLHPGFCGEALEYRLDPHLAVLSVAGGSA